MKNNNWIVWANILFIYDLQSPYLIIINVRTELRDNKCDNYLLKVSLFSFTKITYTMIIINYNSD